MIRFLSVFLLLSTAIPAQTSFQGAAAMDQAIQHAITAGQIPGAVVLVGHDGKVIYQKAYGLRSVQPKREAMTLNTIFDAASLTKVVATSASMMLLLEEGKVRLGDRVIEYLPEFQDGKSEITVRHLMTHFSGLRPDVDLKPEWSGYGTGIHLAMIDKPVAAPGERFIYSDINYVLLGEIVRRVSGKTLDVFARERVFLPLGMAETFFNPPVSLKPRVAPTELTNGAVLRATVHDPTCRFMGGVAGHAGVFTTAADLSRFAEMMLSEGRPLVSPLTARKFVEPQTPLHQYVLRGLGWDMDSPFSSNRGELFPIGSYGHTGFTGTSMWIDPSTRTYVILLSNSVHPKRRPSIVGLRAKVATIAAASVGLKSRGVILPALTGMNEVGVRRPTSGSQNVQTGFEVARANQFAAWAGKRVGLITNHTGLTADSRRNIDVMLGAGVKLTALFSPEHGIAGKEDHENVGHTKDAASGLTVYSLYQGEQRKPSEAMLKEIDVLVVDIQDVGARYYTYISTLKNAMSAAAQANVPIVVLDRPNPIDGLHVEGPQLDPDLTSFIACTVMPLRHGMTLGELARLINVEDKINAQLEVVAMQNWRRTDWWDSTGLLWVNPSPNMRSFTAALLYPGVAMMEYSKNYSVGRGTDAPFEQVGADWIRGPELAKYLNQRFVPGVRFYATEFTPTSSYFAGKAIQGVRMVITDRESFSSLRLGLEIAVAIEKLYPGKIDWNANLKLIGSREALKGIRSAEDPRSLEMALMPPVQAWKEVRAKYLLYQ